MWSDHIISAAVPFSSLSLLKESVQFHPSYPPSSERQHFSLLSGCLQHPIHPSEDEPDNTSLSGSSRCSFPVPPALQVYVSAPDLQSTDGDTAP